MKNSYRDITMIFKEEFSEVTLEKEIVALEKGKAHCIFINISDEKYLKNNWKPMTNSIALNYQNYLETSFEKWNIYLFFLISNCLGDPNLKYAIENNTFSSRKIVEETESSIKKLIKKHVNNELILDDNADKIESSDFSFNPIIYSVLKDKKIKKKNILSVQLKLVYDELIKKFKEDNEI